MYFARIPLKTSPHIVNGNALRLDWAEVLPPERCGYVLGNPPFVGAKFLDKAQRAATAVCHAIRRRFPQRADLQKVYGVGLSASRTVPDALAAIDAALLGASQYATEAASAGILARDLTALTEVRGAVIVANLAQESAKSSKKGSTASKDDLVRDLTRRVDQILGAAELEFTYEPAILAEFRSPLPSKGKKRPGASTDGAPPA